MERSKKRKADDNGALDLTGGDVKTLLHTLSKEQLVDLLQDAALRHTDVLRNVRKVADEDPSPRKIFVRGLGCDTKADAIKKVFSQYGEVEDVVVVTERKTQKGRGYGFVTFTHAESALRALKEPSKVIEGRSTTCNPAAQGAELAKLNPEDITHRKIYVNNIPEDATFEKLHKLFSQFGEIAEGPIGFQKTGKCKGYTLIVYRTLDGARKALEEPLKTFEGHKLKCKLAEVPPAEAKQAELAAAAAMATSASLSMPGSGAGFLGGYALPYGTYDPSGLPTGLALHPGLSHILSNPLAQNLNPAANMSALGLGASVNSMHPSLAALYPSLSSLSSLPSDSAHGFLSGSSLGLASLGAHPGSLAGYPAQLSAYSRLATTSLYDAGTNSTSQSATNPTPSVSSYTAAYLGAAPAERAQIAGALGTLAAYYDR